MTIRILIPVLLLFAFQGAFADNEKPPSLTGNALLISCSNAVKMFDGDCSEPVVFSAPLCIYFIQGFLSGADAMLSKNLALRNKGLKRVACTKDAHVTVMQWARIVEKFLRDN